MKRPAKLFHIFEFETQFAERFSLSYVCLKHLGYFVLYLTFNTIIFKSNI